MSRNNGRTDYQFRCLSCLPLPPQALATSLLARAAALHPVLRPDPKRIVKMYFDMGKSCIERGDHEEARAAAERTETTSPAC